MIHHYSDLMNYRMCSRLGLITNPYLLNKESKTESRPLTVGRSVHKLLELYYTEGEPDYDLVDDVDFYQRIFKHYQMWVDMMAPIKDSDLEFITTGMEKEFTVDIEGTQFGGVIDGLVRYEGKIYLLEHKTSSNLANMAAAQAYLEQTLLYTYCLRQLGIPVSGTLFNLIRSMAPTDPKVLRNGQLSEDKAQKTSFLWYMQYAIAHYGSNELALNTHRTFLQHLYIQQSDWFTRFIDTPSDEKINLAVVGLLRTAKRLEEDTDFFPEPNRLICDKCTFLSPCLAYRETGHWDNLKDYPNRQLHWNTNA